MTAANDELTEAERKLRDEFASLQQAADMSDAELKTARGVVDAAARSTKALEAELESLRETYTMTATEREAALTAAAEQAEEAARQRQRAESLEVEFAQARDEAAKAKAKAQRAAEQAVRASSVPCATRWQYA